MMMTKHRGKMPDKKLPKRPAPPKIGIAIGIPIGGGYRPPPPKPMVRPLSEAAQANHRVANQRAREAFLNNEETFSVIFPHTPQPQEPIPGLIKVHDNLYYEVCGFCYRITAAPGMTPTAELVKRTTERLYKEAEEKNAEPSKGDPDDQS
jgi:hypothetical protein